MKTTETQKLLEDYLRNRSEAAFGEIVERYLGLVHSAALRLVGGDEHLAQDVSQMVFVDLSRAARQLTGELHLGGWLHRHTCFVASKVMRQERRRQKRERQAAEMNPPDDKTAAGLEKMSAVLDHAIEQLNEPDRRAIVLRFFEGCDLRTVGQVLSTNEDAAQKRVSRALDKLRGHLLRRGVSLPASALATLLAAQTGNAAPAGLAASITAAAMGGSAAGSGALALQLHLMKLMAISKLKITLGTVLIAGMSTAIFVEHQTAKTLREQNDGLRQEIQRLSSAADQGPSEQQEPVSVSSIPAEQPNRELLRLRGEVGVLRQRNQELERLQVERRPSPPGAGGSKAQPSSDVEQRLQTTGWGRKSCADIAANYSEAWLNEITSPHLLVKLGLALYDTQKYPEALRVFQKLQAGEEKNITALVWQGQILDLLGRREEALASYGRAAACDFSNFHTRHDQYGIVLTRDYLNQLLEKPFARVDNHDED